MDGHKVKVITSSVKHGTTDQTQVKMTKTIHLPIMNQLYTENKRISPLLNDTLSCMSSTLASYSLISLCTSRSFRLPPPLTLSSLIKYFPFCL